MRVPLPTQVRPAALLRPPSRSAAPETLECWQGRVGELSEAGYWGALSFTAGLIAQAQARGEQTAWIAAGESIFFPPDLAGRGVDLGAVTVIRARQPGAALQAADWLTRSGAFALVVVDELSEPVRDEELGRLGRLAEEADTALLFLTRRGEDEAALGTQVSLKAAVRPVPGGAEVEVRKDKRGSPSRFRWELHGPMGLY